MIRDFEFFHGAALTRLVHAGRRLSITAYDRESNASYVINESCGLYLKHSSSRMSPWGFTFQQYHQMEIDKLYRQLGSVVLGLICNENGIAGLDYGEFRQVLDLIREPVENISVSRKPRGMYMVRGRDGEIKYKIGEGEFVEKVLRSCPN